MRLSYIYFVILAIGIILITPAHIEGTIGLYIFEFLNLPIYSHENETGFHFVNITGILLVAIGIIGVTTHLQTRYPSILKVLLVSIVIIFVAAPIIANLIMILFHYQSKSEQSIYVPSQLCDVEIVNNEVNAFCDVKLMNYGNSKSIELIPYLLETSYEMELDSKILEITPHKKQQFKLTLHGILLVPHQDNQIYTRISFDPVILDK